jgi:KRAB domain-containing zinc finger protein
VPNRVHFLLGAPTAQADAQREKNVLCGNCFSSFPTRVELAEHVKSHVPSSLSKADGAKCQKIFQKCRLAKHVKLSHFNCANDGCKQTFLSASELKAHVVVHCKYKCEHCGVQLKTSSLYSSHVELHTRSATIATSAELGKPAAVPENLVPVPLAKTEDQWHICSFPECSFAFKLLSTLENHKRNSHGDKSINFKLECDVCCKRFTTKAVLENHILGSHLSNYEPMFPCDKCGRRFYTEGNRKAHLRTLHNIIVPPTVYLCDQCPKSFKMMISLEQHQRTHRGEKPFVCSKCGKRFTVLKSLNNHLLTHEQSNSTAFVCEVCGKGFLTSRAYKSHSQMHNERDIECPVCGWKTNNKTLLSSHIKNNHTKKPVLQCDFCDVTSTSKSYLTRHSAATHDDEAPVVTFDCHICGKKLKHQRSLVSHLKLHQRLLEFECDLCHTAFVRKDCLNTHLFEKHGITQHKCNECGLEFAKLVLLKSHMHKKHYNKKALALL